MKAIGGLFEHIPTHANLSRAFWRAAQGKRSRAEVQVWEEHLGPRLGRMADALATESYGFSAYKSFQIRDPKTRVIHAPAFADRVVHHAMIAVLGPVLEQGASDYSYACRKGKGQHAALQQVQRWVQPGDWFLKIDVEKFYDSILHENVLVRLGKRFREKRVLALWASLLDSYSTSWGRGLPIGALTSQYLGNFVLDPIDRIISGTGDVRHCRYMDDFLLLGKRHALMRARDHIKQALSAMGLRMKHGGELNRIEFGIPFLGFTLFHEGLRLNRIGRKRLRRCCKEHRKTLRREGRGPQRDELESLRSQFAHACVGSDRNWRRARCRDLEDFWEGQGQSTGAPWRELHQLSAELPRVDPQQESSGQSKQEQRLPPLSVLRHGGVAPPPDVALSSAPLVGDEPIGQCPTRPDICDESMAEKVRPESLADTSKQGGPDEGR